MEQNKINILLVDDEIDVRDYGGRVLKRRLNLNLTTLDSGKTAIEAIRTIPFDIVLLDLNLPDYDGWKVISEVRKFNVDVKIIIITGHLDVYFTEEQNGIIKNQTIGVFHKGDNVLPRLINKLVDTFGKSILKAENQVVQDEYKGRPEAREIVHTLNGLVNSVGFDVDEYYYALEHGFFKDKTQEEHISRLQRSFKEFQETMKLCKKEIEKIRKL